MKNRGKNSVAGQKQERVKFEDVLRAALEKTFRASSLK